ncbi:MAG: esterase-like activity of phytase family protein [Chitinophagales bacterium]
MKKIIAVILLMFTFCTNIFSQTINQTLQSDSIVQLKFLDEYDVSNGKEFMGTTIGGLSGIDYDAKRDVYYLISDDRSAINPARFYSAKIYVGQNKIDSVEFIDVKSLLQKNGKPYPNSKQDPFHTPDPEDMRYDPKKDEMVWSSEGERIVKPGNNVLEDPSVIAIDRNGKYKAGFSLPANMHMHETENGPRQNSVFEGLTFTDDYKYLFVSVEEPIYEDGPRAGPGDSTALIRILKFNSKTRKPIAQYAYQIEPVAYPPIPSNAFKINGVSDILWVGENQLMVIERSFSTGRLACTIRIFLADMNNAADIAGVQSLRSQPALKPVSKKLLLNMDDLHRYIDNIEGVTFGPVLSNGHRTLLFVADNNFSPIQRNQFLLFEIIP